jgi:hypothetical protein
VFRLVSPSSLLRKIARKALKSILRIISSTRVNILKYRSFISLNLGYALLGPIYIIRYRDLVFRTIYRFRFRFRFKLRIR